MADTLCDDDPEPSPPSPAGPLYVPVRPGPSGCAARFFRTPLGDRTAVAFTSERRLTATLGTGHLWIRLAEPALRALTEPLGVTALTVDPQLSAPVPTARPRRPGHPAPSGAGRRTWTAPDTVAARRATGAAALVEGSAR
ncbi:SAV_915 family protein [Streptomyces sp. NPDC091377]|uniref:SAV_915 family protein n=1 Tax=Streptomyces sp. NPDC091377 TaxID=3365995 RepID=UPI0037F9EBCD